MCVLKTTLRPFCAKLIAPPSPPAPPLCQANSPKGTPSVHVSVTELSFVTYIEFVTFVGAAGATGYGSVYCVTPVLHTVAFVFVVTA